MNTNNVEPVVRAIQRIGDELQRIRVLIEKIEKRIVDKEEDKKE